MATNKTKKEAFLHSLNLILSLEKAYRSKTTFEEKFSHALNKEFDKVVQCLNFKRDKYRQKKTNEYKEHALLVLNNEMFLSDVRKITKKWELDKYKYPISILDFAQKNVPLSITLWENKLIYFSLKERKNYLYQFQKDADELLYKYDFDKLWEQYLVGFLLSGVLVLPLEYCRIFMRFDEYTNSPLLFIELTPNTTLEDIKQRWNDIENIKNQLYPFRKKRGKTSRNIEKILSLRNSYELRWELVEEKFKTKERRLKAIEALRKAEKRLQEKQRRILARGIKRKFANLPTSIKEFEEMFGKINKYYYL